MAKVSRTYRFDEQTLEQIRWLGSRLGGLDDTSILRLAVAELYHLGEDPLPGRFADIGVVVEDLRNRGHRDAELGGDTLHGHAHRRAALTDHLLAYFIG